jgi:hypothetical protein
MNITPKIKPNKYYEFLLEKKIRTDNKNYKYYKGFLKGKSLDKMNKTDKI